MKRVLSILLSLALVIGLIGPVIAVEETDAAELAASSAIAKQETKKEDNKDKEPQWPLLSADAYDMTYYVGGYGAVRNRYRCTVDFGETEDGGWDSWNEWYDIAYGDPIVSQWPTEPGTYAVTFEQTAVVEGTEYVFTVPMNIRVLELPQTYGQCGDEMWWTFDTGSDTLYIYGEGDMYTIADSRDAFWEENYLYEPGWWKLPVRHVVIENGVRNLSDFTFFADFNSYYDLMETIELPQTLQAIPEMGFLLSTSMESLTIPEGVTSLTGWPFGSPGNSFMKLRELYLPATLERMDITTIMLSGLDAKSGQVSLETIYYAGTQEQWYNIIRVESESIRALFGDDYEGFYENWCKPFLEIFEKVNVCYLGNENPGDDNVDITSLDITLLSTEINVSSMSAQIVYDRFIDEETGEEIYGPEWIYYNWAEHCRVSALIDGEFYENIRLSTLADISANNAGVWLSGGIIDNQSYENQWQVGGSYPVNYYIFAAQGDYRTLWIVDLTVTICEPSPKIEISDITVDELSGWMDGDVRQYRWEEHGRMDVTIDGALYEDISLWQLQELMLMYGPMDYLVNAAPGYEEDNEKLWNPYENPWTVGDELHALLTIYGGEDHSLLYNDVICIRLQQTQIESVSIAPITYYVHDYSGDPEITVHYKDGTSKVTDEYSYMAMGDWPSAPGNYTMNFLVAGTFAVTAPVTVLPTPHTGSLGNTVTWTYDEATDTMTLSGTGAAVYGDDRPWTRLLMALQPSKIVVGEGIEYMQEGIFYMGLFIEELVLPTSLKEVPHAMICYNGPTAGTYLEAEYGNLPGMSSIVIPEGITRLTFHPFYLCWGLTDFYLPSTLQEMDIDALCSVVALRAELGFAAQEMTIHFAGTKAQWDAIRHVASSTREDFGSGWSDEQLEAVFATFTVICAGEETTAPAAMDLSGDGKVTIFDAQILAEAKAGLRTLTEEQLAAIGTLTPEDILNYVLGKQTQHTHSYVEMVVPPTCEEDSYIVYTCSTCGDSYQDKLTPAMGHHYTLVSDTATCTADGTRTEICENCKQTVTAPSAAKGHGQMRTEITGEPCIGTGIEKMIFTVCNMVLSEKTVQGTGAHSWEYKPCSEVVKDEMSRGLMSQPKYASFTDHCVAVCSVCKTSNWDDIVQRYSDYETAAIMLGYVNDLRESVLGTSEYNLVLDNGLINKAKNAAKAISTDYAHTSSNENISMSGSNIYEQFIGWKNSPGHYASMVNADENSVGYCGYTRFGYAMYRVGTRLYGVQEFGY